MSSRRFELITRFLHLNDSASQPQRGEPSFDKLYKVCPFMTLVLQNFKDNYIPNQQLSIDESMISYKGRLSFIQYLPKKPHKWGMKAWVLADSLNGYSWGWKLYTGKDGSSGGPGLAHRVVMDLADDQRLEGKGYFILALTFSKLLLTKVLVLVEQLERIGAAYHSPFGMLVYRGEKLLAVWMMACWL